MTAFASHLIDRVLDWLLLRLADFVATPSSQPRQSRTGVLLKLADWLEEKAGGNAPYSAARSYVEMGRLDAAAAAFADAERLYERQLGLTHPYVALAAEYRAWCCVMLGRYAEAVPLYEKVLALAHLSAGPNSDLSNDIRGKLEAVRLRLQEE